MVLKDKKTRITFHAGILTIGGTIIEVAYGDARIFFDFGSEFRPELVLAEETFPVLLENELIPEIENIYDWRLTGKPLPHDQNVGVFISHCHLDHTRVMNWIDPSVPVFTLKDTHILLNALNRDGDFLLPGKDLKQTRDIVGLNNRDVIKIGEIEVTLQRVDHDAYGACGFLIKTPDLSIAYTGDLRLHGYDRQDTLDFCEMAKETDVLIIEGVSVSFDEDDEHPENPIKSEKQLIEHINQLLLENPDKQISFNTYPANVKRLAHLVQESHRVVVLEESYARILKDCLEIDSWYYRVSETEDDLNPKFELTLDEVLDHPTKYLVQMTQDFDKLQGGGIYIHSDAVPLGEFDPYYLPFVEMFVNMDIQFERVACSGHATPEDLQKIIDLIEPKLLIPIHSYRPERLENRHGERHLPTRKETL